MGLIAVRLHHPAPGASIEEGEDEDRYVRGKAAHALRRIGTPEAQEALFHFLTMSQWCYSTTKESMY